MPGDPNSILEGFSGITPEGLRVLQEHFVDLESMEHVRHGGQGVVFRAVERSTNRTVAVKLLLNGPLATAAQRARFEREVELIARLRHPNIVTLYGSGEVQGRLYFTMEFVDGQSIDDYALLNDLTPHDIVRLIIKVCRAINYSHQNGIIHRDLTPNNILVDADSEPRIFDFGLAKDMRAENESVTQHVVGTIPFMSPEQIGGLDGHVDTRADIYSLGLILYHLLTEGYPYPIAGSFDQIRGHLLSTDPIPLRRAVGASSERMRGAEQLTRDLEAIIETALAKQKQDRYQTANALAEDLERYLTGEAVQARSKSKYYRIRKTIQRNWLAFSITAGFAAIVFIAGIAVTAAWVRAAADRDRATLAAGSAFEMCAMALREVEQSVARLPGGSAIRDRIIARMEQELPKLSRLDDSSAELTEIRAMLAERQGELAEQLGDVEQARRSYAAFHALVFDADESFAPETRLRAYEKFAPWAADPEQMFLEGLRVARELQMLHPERNEVALSAAALELRYARYLSERDELTKAIVHVDRTDAFQTHASAAADASAWQILLAQSMSLRGNIHLRLGDGQLADEALHAAVRLARRAVEAEPANTHAQFEVMRCCSRLAKLLRARERDDEARAYFEEGARYGNDLFRMDRSVTAWDTQRISLHHELAVIALEDKNYALAAEEVFRVSELAMREQIVRPASRSAAWRLAWSDLLESRLAGATGDSDHALACATRAVQARELMVAADPHNLRALGELADSYFWMGFATRSLGLMQSSADHYRRYSDLRCELAKRNLDSVELQVAYASARFALALALTRTNEQSAAYEAEQLVRDMQNDLRDLDASGRVGEFRAQVDGLQGRAAETLEWIWSRMSRGLSCP